jgi:uncharacterized protein (TIGR00297 family)
VGAVISVPFAFMASRVAPISRAGALAGAACATLIYTAFYLAGFAVLGVALALTIAASRAAAARERDAEASPRGTRNILANCGVGTAAAIVELTNLGLRTELTATWCVTALAAGASDTVASELGRAFGGAPRAFPTWQRVQPGTPGAISLVGTAAGVVAASLIAVPAAALWLLPWSSLLLVVGATTAGAFVESLLATTLEPAGRLGNHALNAINTLVAAALALFLTAYGRP